MRYIICSLLFCFFVGQLQAQETSVYTEAQLFYKRGKDFADKGLWGQAQTAYQKAMDLSYPINAKTMDNIHMLAELGYAKSAVRLDQLDGEKLILDFVRNYQPDPLANEAIIEAGNYYYDAKVYDKALTFFSMIDTYNLSKDEKSEVLFKKGYALFVRKQFPAAMQQFKQIQDLENKYYYPTNYYLGMCHFFQGAYKFALASFNKVEQSKKYRAYVPYYKTQIYFSEGQFDKVLEYGLPLVDKTTTRNRKEIHQLIGQAYFEKGDYAKALPHLEAFASKATKMREEDFYQLGFVQYQARNYKGAANNLKELGKLNTALGQDALYILADSYIKLGDKTSARNAFATVQRMAFNPVLQKEALWNYGKLSYELNYDREAINALQRIAPTSPYYAEAQTIMSNIFLNTRDYAKAMESIEGIANKTPELRTAYQKVAFYRGLQVYKDGNTGAAKTLFLKSLEVPTDKRTKALANYWLGEMAHNEGDYEESTRKLNQFFSAGGNMSNLPDQSSIYTANYTMGYNYLKQQDYGTALGYFRKTVDAIKGDFSYINDDYITKQLFGDAILRTGDCYFKANDYDNALRYYDEAVKNRYDGYIYATYQKAIIEGLRGNTTDKIIALEEITRNSADSEYADDALFALGLTYQELGKYNEAVAPLNDLVSQHKNSPLYNQSLITLGLITYNQGDFNQSIRHYKAVFQNNPTEKEGKAALTALEEIYVSVLGQPDEYFNFLESIPGYKVDDQDKENISYKAAETQFENGNYDRAIQSYQTYLSRYPNGRFSLNALYNIAESYAVQKNYTQALLSYEKVVGRGQSRFYGKAINKAALISYNHAEDFAKAYEYYTLLEQIADTDDLRFDAQIGALRSAYRINKTDAVYTMANKVRNNPKASKEQMAAANFYIGKIAFDKGTYPEALTAFNQVVRNSDNEQTAEARYLIAYIYYQQRDLDVAKQICLNANKESSSYQFWVAKSVILLADILAEQNDLFNAKAALEAVIENFTEDQSLVDLAKTKLILVDKRIEENSRIETDSPDADLRMLDGGR